MENEIKKVPEFKARIIKTDDGKVQISIQCTSETIKYPDGRQDVTIFAPNLSLIDKALNPFEKEE